MKACPRCGRRLLSQASARCNWCAHVIDDAEYQAKAATERETFFTHQAEHDARSLVSMSSINPAVSGFGQILPGTPPHTPPARDTSAVSLAPETNQTGVTQGHDPQNCQDAPRPPTTGGRFLHLEWDDDER